MASDCFQQLPTASHRQWIRWRNRWRNWWRNQWRNRWRNGRWKRWWRRWWRRWGMRWWKRTGEWGNELRKGTYMERRDAGSCLLTWLSFLNRYFVTVYFFLSQSITSMTICRSYWWNRAKAQSSISCLRLAPYCILTFDPRCIRDRFMGNTASEPIEPPYGYSERDFYLDIHARHAGRCLWRNVTIRS